MNTTPSVTELHAVFATDYEHNTWRVSDPLSSAQAHAEWTKLDELRLAGRTPQFKFFEVRSVWLENERSVVGADVRSHDRYDNAPVLLDVRRSTNSRGFKTAEAAARAAWRLFFPEVSGKTQGAGGWFYYSNGATAAQGLHHLARVAEKRGLVFKGGNGRYFVTEPQAL